MITDVTEGAYWVVVPDLSVHRDSLQDGAARMDDVAATLDSLRTLIDDHSYLPLLAFGSIGEGARYNYTVSREDELANLATGVSTAHTFAGHLRTSHAQYLSAEDANVRAVLYDRGWLPDSHGAFKAPPVVDDNPTTTAPAIGMPADLTAIPATAALVSSGAMKIAEIGAATAANLKACAGMSALTIGAAAAWATVVWSNDGSIDQAVQTWDQVAKQARAIFGSDVTAVRKALQTAWHGNAAATADGRILEFVIAGMALADRAERRVAALRELISELIAVHWLAFGLSTAMLVTVVAGILSVGLTAFTAMYADWFAWAVALIDGLLMSWGMVALWDQSQDGFALRGADDGSAAQAVAVTPVRPSRSATNPNVPPPFSF
jgi:hypothetical protein